MKATIVILTVATSLLACAMDAAERPNIVLIFADDLGWRDVGYNGSDFHETPNIDRLGREGIKTGRSHPSRASM
jgi:arylsulfatase A-like enzyme